MKKKTKFQQRVIDLSLKLKPISDKQKDWAILTLSENYAVVSRNRTFCLECGHKWNEGLKLAYLLEKCTCPNCNKELKYNQNTDVSYEATYFAILTTKGGMQVVRMFLFRQFFKKYKKTSYHFEEVMQHWIDKYGKTESLSRPVNNMTYQIDQWIPGELEVRTHSDRHCQRFYINPFKIYPVRRIIPKIKRNGFDGYFRSFSPQELFSLLLKSNQAESLFKTRQFDLLKVIESRGDKINKYWNSINICTRHAYEIKNATDWLDHLGLLEHFGKDLNSPKYISPENLKLEHDKLVRKKKKIDNEIRTVEEEKRNIEYQEQYTAQKRKFFGLKFHVGNITISTITTIAGFKEEANCLKHCVYSGAYFKKEDSLIMSAKIEGKPVETIEISLKNFKIIQSRGLQNKASKYHDKIIDVVQQNISKITDLKEIELTKKAS